MTKLGLSMILALFALSLPGDAEAQDTSPVDVSVESVSVSTVGSFSCSIRIRSDQPVSNVMYQVLVSPTVQVTNAAPGCDFQTNPGTVTCSTSLHGPTSRVIRADGSRAACAVFIRSNAADPNISNNFNSDPPPSNGLSELL